MKRAKRRVLPSRRPYVILLHPDTYTELIRDSEFARIYDKAIEHIAAVTMIPRELMQCPEWLRRGEIGSYESFRYIDPNPGGEPCTV